VQHKIKKETIHNFRYKFIYEVIESLQYTEVFVSSSHLLAQFI